MEVFELLSLKCRPMKVQNFEYVTCCRHCLTYRDSSGNEIDVSIIPRSTKITNRFCDAECHREYNKEFLTPSRNN